MKKVLTLLLTAVALTGGSLVAADPVKVKLVGEVESVQPGETFWVATQFELEKGWHIYWTNPGESGMATEITWEVPEGFEVKRVEWPKPEKLHGELTTYGYEGKVMVLAEVAAPEKIIGDNVTITADAQWLACSEMCLPGGESTTLTLPVASGAPKAHAQWGQPIAQAREHLPQATTAAKASLVDGKLNLQVEAAGVSGAYFFPEQEGLFDAGLAQELTAMQGSFSLSLPTAGESVKNLKGVLVVDSAEGSHALKIDTALGGTLGGGSFAWSKFFMMLGVAFLGGLILNLMPCVLPVVSLKVFQFINMAGSSRRQAFRHGVIFTIGVVVSFWVLAGALLLLRHFGEGVGWGFQLQEPLFVAILVIGLFLFGLSLLGIFEMGTSLAAAGGKQHQGAFGTFMSGVLATIVATPCTGPLLAPALGFAVTLPAFAGMVMFTSVALGMASPYLLLSAFPELMKWMPKPGAWMIVFKQIMGWLMLATVIWLLWVFQSQVSDTALILLLAALFVMAIAAWIYGSWGTPVQGKRTRYIARGFAVALVALGCFIGLRDTDTHEEWATWSTSKVTEARAEGKYVFVDFTAKWCLICQANKRPMHSAEVATTYNEAGVVMMEADWTSKDPEITKELAKFGRNGVPLYLLYSPDPNEAPQVLPQVLTNQVLVDSLGLIQRD